MAEKVGSIYYSVELDTGEMIAGQRRVQRELDKTSGDLGTLNTKLTAVAAASAAAAVAIGVMAKSLYEASAAGERLKTMLDFATGGNGTREIEYLRALTNRLGLEFATTAVAYGQFQAAAKGTALEGQKARDVFESVAKASAVMGLSSANTSGVLLALQQMISKGTVQAEELRGQLGERLPGAFQIAAKAMGVTTAELGKMLEQGQVIADDFLPKFAAALNENIGNAAENAAGRLDASVNRFSSSWEKLKQTVGNSGISRFFANEMEALSQSMTTVTEGMENTKKAGGGMIAQFASAGGIAAGRVAFDLLNGSANVLNGTINLLTGGIFGLRTDLALLPDALKTNAQQAAVMGEKIQEAQAKLVRLQELDAQPMNGDYYKQAIAATAAYIAKLKEAQAEKQGLQGGATDPRDIPANMQRGAGYARYAAEQKKAADDLIAVRQRQMGINKTYMEDLNAYQNALKLGILTEKEYVAAVSDLAKKTYANSASGKDGRNGAKFEAKSLEAQAYYQGLIAANQNALDKIDAEETKALTENQKRRATDGGNAEIYEKAKVEIHRKYARERALLEEKATQDAAELNIATTTDQVAKVEAVRTEAVRRAAAAEKLGTMTHIEAEQAKTLATFTETQQRAAIQERKTQANAEAQILLTKSTEQAIILIRDEAVRQAEAAYKRGQLTFEESETEKTKAMQKAIEARKALEVNRTAVEVATLQIKASSGGSQDRENQIRASAAAEIAQVEQARLLDLEASQTYADQKVAIEAKMQRDITDLRANANAAAIGSTADIFGSLTSIMKAGAGEQSGIYQAMFEAQKAFSIAQSIVAIQAGIANAASLPFPANLGAMASVAAATASIVSTISGTNYGGGRQYGGPASAGSMYRVNETGAPEMFTANNGNQYMLPTKSGRVTSADNVGGGGISVVVNVDASGSSVEGDGAQSKQLGAMIGNAVRAVLIQEKRNGGLLA